MNESEFMAMLDERLSDGKRYPTLDDYTKALNEIAWAEEQRVKVHVRPLRPPPPYTDSVVMTEFGQWYRLPAFRVEAYHLLHKVWVDIANGADSQDTAEAAAIDITRRQHFSKSRVLNREGVEVFTWP